MAPLSLYDDGCPAVFITTAQNSIAMAMPVVALITAEKSLGELLPYEEAISDTSGPSAEIEEKR